MHWKLACPSWSTQCMARDSYISSIPHDIQTGSTMCTCTPHWVYTSIHYEYASINMLHLSASSTLGVYTSTLGVYASALGMYIPPHWGTPPCYGSRVAAGHVPSLMRNISFIIACTSLEKFKQRYYLWFKLYRSSFRD